ncbi:hypothetical protein MBM_09933 [Drepanopeziza brunnea f. sp. 'multigermtubi' MB_m1]|uniref:Uncharacterized protein n=1 Tax=Marssonina brunnea f. sp. multigermtubi (strain MB_m1) TaxID=1072389 RepID=K1W4M9_MARBU|nr:uncharacterized protein MBM_09933 [Drepanopeziza brunnea f. sp. 'multigermtubi' MB_m1]EKD11910.1 hypothetical protein MBM_09933 [Drepanopeziza brunnea f. sp. 'multigermtubi' MB_m1]
MVHHQDFTPYGIAGEAGMSDPAQAGTATCLSDNNDLGSLFEDSQDEQAYPISEQGLANTDGPEDRESQAKYAYPSLEQARAIQGYSNDKFWHGNDATAPAPAPAPGHAASGMGFIQSAYENFQQPFVPDSYQKRKRVGEDNGDNRELEHSASPLLKCRKTKPSPEEDQLARESEMWAPGEVAKEDKPRTTGAIADARELGTHLAAPRSELPTKRSHHKRYPHVSRSAICASLELTTEAFGLLQAGAKAFMLDPKFPKRSACVGTRGKNETERTGLDLLTVVDEFLDDEGWGERLFSEGSIGEEGEARKLTWPKMKMKLRSLVIPVVRVAVSNEKARLYGIESRRKQRTSVTSAEVTPQPDRARLESVTPAPTRNGADVKLDDNHSTVDAKGYELPHSFAVGSPASSNGTHIRYLVNLMQHGHRLVPEITPAPNTCLGFPSLVEYINRLMDTASKEVSSIDFLVPTGMVNVKNEEDWKGAIASIEQTEWMNGEVKCVVVVIDKEQ